MKDKKRKYTTITIPTALFENVSRSIQGTGFSSVSDYSTYILRETVAELKLDKGSKQSRSAIIEKLRALGYIS